ncbi:MAG: hypothetical protein ACK6CT_02490 [Planctomycetia bacterium]|jgi:hypothetical protein
MKCSRNAVLLAAVMAGAFAASQRPALAHKEFLEEFKKVYAPKDDTPFAKEVETAKCNVCHAGTSKKERNAYGEALDKLLTKEDKKNPDKIRKAFDEVGALPSDPAMKDSPTFGKLLEEGKLPVPAK